MENDKKIYFICNGKVPECKKTSCYFTGAGECKKTSHVEYAANFKKGKYGNMYTEIEEPQRSFTSTTEREA